MKVIKKGYAYVYFYIYNYTGTGTTKHPFDTRKEKMKQNSPNMFETYKTKETVSD